MKKLLIIIIVLAVVGGGAFYGGMKYAQDKAFSGIRSLLPENFQDLSSEQRQQFMQKRGEERGLIRGGGEEKGLGFLNGEVIARDEESITLKMLDGSSKIVFFSDSTLVTKTINGSAADIEIGKQVTINGTANSDGSVTAQTISVMVQVVK